MIHYPEMMATSQQLFERAQRCMPGGNTRTTVYIKPTPVYMERGEGCRIWDVDGNCYYDCINNFTSLIHGHAFPPITDALTTQTRLGTAFGAPTASEIDLAELLVTRLPAVDQIRFTNSGTEAVMMAIKAARAFTQRPAIVKVEGAYHGTYDFAETSLDSSPENWGEQPASVAYASGTPSEVLADVFVVPFNDMASIQRVFEQHGSAIAAIIVDPMPNRVGLIPARKDFLEELIATAHRHGSLVIFDEVISFRLSHSGAQGLWGVTPDLTTLGKVIGGGLPVGAVGGQSEVMAVFDPTHGKPAVPHGGTFTANPMTMRAGLAAMTALTPDAYERLAGMGEFMRRGINASLHKHQIPGICVGKGSLFKIHFTDKTLSDYRSVYPEPAQKAALDQLHKGLLNRGVFCASYALFALSTPMTDEDTGAILTAIDDTLSAMAEHRR